MAGYKERVVKGFAINLGMAFAIAGLGYLTRIILAKNLSLAEYGLFYAVFAFIGFFNLFRDFGLGVTSVKFISGYLGKNDRKGIKTTVKAVFVTQLIMVSLITLPLILFSGQLAQSFFKADATYVIIFLALGYFLSLSQDAIVSLAGGFQNMLYMNLPEFLRHALIIIVIILGLGMDRSAVLPAFAYFIVMVFLPFFHLRLLLRLMPDFFGIEGGRSIPMLKKAFSFSIPVMITTIGGLLIAYTDTMMITYFRTLEEVGLYNVAMPISMIIWFFGNALAGIMLPVISQMWARKEKKYVREGIALLHKYAFAIVLPFGLTFFAFPEIIIRVLFGEEYVGSALALQILSIGAIAYSIAIVNSNILVGLGKPGINGRIMLVAAAFNILANALMIPKFGIAGAAIASSVSYTLVFLMNTFYLRKLVGANLPLRQYLKSILGGGLFLLTLTLLKKNIELNAYLEAIVVSTASLLIYLGYLYISKTIDVDETRNVLGNLMRR